MRPATLTLTWPLQHGREMKHLNYASSLSPPPLSLSPLSHGNGVKDLTIAAFFGYKRTLDRHNELDG